MVGHPVAINPDSRLRRHAREHNWPVYDFRSGRRAATLGLKAATAGGAIYGLWRGFSRFRGPGPKPPATRSSFRHGIAAAASLGRTGKKNARRREGNGHFMLCEVSLLLIAALVARLAKQLAVLLLGHTLATLLNN